MNRLKIAAAWLFVTCLFSSSFFVTESAWADPMGAAVGSQSGTCPAVIDPVIEVKQSNSNMFENDSKSSIEIAKMKGKRYEMKMPPRQGSISIPSFHIDTYVETRKFETLGCVVIDKLIVDIAVEQRIDIASEYDAGTCAHDQFYSLEVELMQQDEMYINQELAKLKDSLEKQVVVYNLHGPVPDNVRLEKVDAELKQGFTDSIEREINGIEAAAYELHRKSDQPTFYDDILRDCGAMR